MKITDVLQPTDIKFVPLTFIFLHPLKRQQIFFSNRKVTVTKYKSFRVTVYPPAKKISLIL